ncbi:purine-nucleoside phosphorylase [Gorillibacterium timonense]|uniref:purine-nucleoside phosphorylase n=1 Tax=Gorillibacterium timonense TaxID=1689269 RepID=UPI00071C33FF|nr:purine-nucleoside phosphorylase [Gorillibacterium timonense]
MPTPHNQASKDDIAKVVLMPGDPLRAKFIAETYLENPRLVNQVRNSFAYTGTYKGKTITVMSSGMGMPSIGIYSYELFKFYDVECIIRVGSAGAYTDQLALYDIVLADSAWSESNFAKSQSGETSDVLTPSPRVNAEIEKAAGKLGYPITTARIHSSDVFYAEEHMPTYKNFYEEKGCVCVEMESFALFHNAKVTGKSAACLLTISDSLVDHTATTAEERQTSFNKMMEIALDAAVELA